MKPKNTINFFFSNYEEVGHGSSAAIPEKTKEFMKKNFKWLVLFIALIGFLALAEDVFNKEIMNGDIVGYDIVSKLFKFNVSTPIAKFMTNFGGAIYHGRENHWLH